jgi:uncharacterized protein YciI
MTDGSSFFEVTQPVYYVVSMTTKFTSMDEVRAHAPGQLVAHVARSAELHRAGPLLMAGAFTDHPGEPVATMGVLTTRADAEEFARADPFVIAGMVDKWEVRNWGNIFAAMTRHE